MSRAESAQSRDEMDHERTISDSDADGRRGADARTSRAPLADSSAEEDEDESNPSLNRPAKRSYWQEFVDYVLNGLVITPIVVEH